MFSFLMNLLGWSQTVKLKAYVQAITPGNVPVRMNEENGNTQSSQATSKDQYFIYLIHSKNSRVIPVQMWLRGKLYSIKTNPITQTPVEMHDNMIPSNPTKITLVPKTEQQVVQLLPIASTISKTIVGKDKAKANEAVVVYKLNGKFYTVTQKKLTRLKPQFNE
jgi:hypothetical protein